MSVLATEAKRSTGVDLNLREHVGRWKELVVDKFHVNSEFGYCGNFNKLNRLAVY
jgi:hypothetical protein